MSGLVGVWALDGRPLDERLLARMSAALGHRGPDGEGRRIVGAAGFACQHQWVTPEEIGEHQPLVGQGGDVLLMLDGRVDNREELLPILGLSKTASDAACALAAYEKWGERFAERLNGDFAIAVFDATRHRLVLARDAIGVRPLYYFQSPKLFAFASEIKALLAHPDVPREPDDEGIADYLLVSSRPIHRQEVTCFKGIFALVPAHLAVVTSEGVVTRRYWDFDTERVIRLRTFDEYVEAFRERFARAVARRLRSARPVAIAVSGGLDSSSVLCQALQLVRGGRVACPEVRGFSYFGRAGSGADESQYQQVLEQAYGIALSRFPVDDLIGIADGSDEQVLAAEAPFLDYLWGIARALYTRAAEAGSRVLLSGLWGDQVLFSPAYLVDLCRRLAWRTIRQHTREYRRWMGAEETGALWRQLLLELGRSYVPRRLIPPLKWVRRRYFKAERPKPWFSRAFLRRALRYANEPALCNGRFASAHARALYLEARSKYHVHCLEQENKVQARYGLDGALPMLDRDLLAFLMAIPGSVYAWNGVPRGLLREAMRDIVPDGVRLRASKGDFTEYVNRGVARDLGEIRRVLHPGSLVVERGYVDPTRLEEAVARLADGLTRSDCLDAWDLADLYGFEKWLHRFFASARRTASERSMMHEPQAPAIASEKAGVLPADP